MARLWGLVVIACGLAAALGFLVAANVGDATGDYLSAFAAGALLAMLTDSLFPFAFERGGDLAGLFTVLGFASSVALA
jgi:ZIP family zinc transporter